ncbi:MAG: hypothetical protein Q8920_12170, partial [Bacillota bacterium]|nr:hypothetical protein [Bacillota bacterium]
MEYDFYLFDADDTLFDYDKAEEKALEQTFSSFGLDYFLDVRHRYGEINKALWRLFEQGKITKSELQTKRFLLLFNEIGINCDAKEFNSKYIVELGKGVYLIDQAENVCKTLYQKHKK